MIPLLPYNSTSPGGRGTERANNRYEVQNAKQYKKVMKQDAKFWLWHYHCCALSLLMPSSAPILPSPSDWSHTYYISYIYTACLILPRLKSSEESDVDCKVRADEGIKAIKHKSDITINEAFLPVLSHFLYCFAF